MLGISESGTHKKYCFTPKIWVLENKYIKLFEVVYYIYLTVLSIIYQKKKTPRIATFK